jgi:signal recognition particle receptor subunit beta
MAVVNYLQRNICFKVVYYGTALGGKTTNLGYIHSRLDPANRSELVTMSTETDRTLFFDFLSIDLGGVKGFNTQFALYTVPGQVQYNESRRMILQGADGIVFVADSSNVRMQENKESIQNMFDNLASYHLKPKDIPWVLQYNKRDISDAATLETMEQQLNKFGVPSFHSVATEGINVFKTLKGVIKLVIDSATTAG